MGIVFISKKACTPLKEYLSSKGHEIFFVESTDLVHPAISAHPDIYMCRINDDLYIDEMTRTTPSLKNVLPAKEISAYGQRSMPPYVNYPAGIKSLRAGLGSGYPADIPYNAVSTSEYFIHNTEHTAPELLSAARSAGLHIISVKQGYTKCSCVTVGSHAVITSDKGIISSIKSYNELNSGNTEISANGKRITNQSSEATPHFYPIDTLLIEKGHVHLDSFPYGFLGGASGCIDSEIIFNGDISVHPDFERITAFISEHGFSIKWFKNEELTDIGSLIYMP